MKPKLKIKRNSHLLSTTVPPKAGQQISVVCQVLQSADGARRVSFVRIRAVVPPIQPMRLEKKETIVIAGFLLSLIHI